VFAGGTVGPDNEVSMSSGSSRRYNGFRHTRGPKRRAQGYCANTRSVPSLSIAGRKPWLDAWLVGLGLAAAAGLAVRGHPADYVRDAGPAIDALADGRVNYALGHQPLMGSVSVLLRSPVVALVKLGGGSELLRYRAGVFLCLVPAGLLGALLGQAWRNSWRPEIVRALIVLLAVANPASQNAAVIGHPEEALGAALCIGAVVLAYRGRVLLAAVALGLALATKQWAVLAVAPTLVAAPSGTRLRLAIRAGALATILTAPLVIGNTAEFIRVSHSAATGALTVPNFDTWWFLIANPLPHWVSESTHPAIVLASAPIALLVWRRSGERSDAFALCALLFLVRCVFDPIDYEYYHLPLLLALLTWETLSQRALPYATLLTAAAMLVTFRYLYPVAGNGTTSVVYLALTVGLAIYLLRALRLFPPRFRLREGCSTRVPRVSP
jgi:hypothetical protein